MDRKDFCGPYWMPSFMRRFLSSKFNASCKIHDLDYESQKFSQREADIRFITHMIKQCDGKFFWEVLAVLYFLSVRIGGKISFNKAKKEATKK
jgi:hypothetical protein